jgi:hypothetical protein
MAMRLSTINLIYFTIALGANAFECKRGKLAAIESKREFAFLEKITARSCEKL